MTNGTRLNVAQTVVALSANVLAIRRIKMLKSLIDASLTDNESNLVKDYRSLRAVELKEQKDETDKKRILRLSASVDIAYQKLSDHEKREVVRALAKEGLAPHEWVALQDAVSGTVVRI